MTRRQGDDSAAAGPDDQTAVCPVAPDPDGARGSGSRAPAAGPRVAGMDPLLAGIVGAIATILAGVAVAVSGGLPGSWSAAVPAAAAAAAPAQAQSRDGTTPAGLSDALSAALDASTPIAADGATSPTPGQVDGGGSVAGGGGVAAPQLAGRLVEPSPGGRAPTYVSFVLDGSGSMLEPAGGGLSKIAEAKSVIVDALDNLPAGTFGSVRLFGARVPEADKPASCRDSHLIVPFLPGVGAGSALAGATIVPKGWTPLAENLTLAARDFPNGVRRVIVVVSDGKETCGGDPVAAARAIKQADPATSIYTVGFAVDPKARTELRTIAQVGGGTYEDAPDRAGLLQALRKIGQQASVGTRS